MNRIQLSAAMFYVVLAMMFIAGFGSLYIRMMRNVAQYARCQYACIGYNEYFVDQVDQCFCVKTQTFFKPTHDSLTKSFFPYEEKYVRDNNHVDLPVRKNR